MAIKKAIVYAFTAVVIISFTHGVEGDENTDTISGSSDVVLIAKCPKQEEEEETDDDKISYCNCDYPTKKKPSLKIMCDFKYEKNVILTDDIYEDLPNLSSVYVRIMNATSVNVTSSFLKKLMKSPSIALDLWRTDTLYLSSMPAPEEKKHTSYKTFLGIGIVNCFVPVVPKYFMRDRTRGALRFKTSHIGTFLKGALHNMEEIRYLVFQDTKVDIFEGPIATEGFLTLSMKDLHSWNGLVISNTTIDTISSSTFNITHRSDMETTSITESKIGSLNTHALIVTGDIDVQIENNFFQRLETYAIKVAVTGEVSFDKNEISNWEPDALEGLMCHNRTSLEENVFHVDDPTDIAINISATPFHNSCGTPQLFLVVSQQHPVILEVSTTSAWIIGTILFLLVAATVIVGVIAHQRQNLQMHFYRIRGRMPDLRERKPSQENLPNGAEIDPSTEATEEGMSNPIYVNVNENS